MASNVDIFCVACAGEPAPTNFQRTVLNGVSRDVYQNHTEFDAGDPAPIWGITSGKADMYSHKISSGDIFLFYTGENAYTYMATVLSSEYVSELSEEIWTDRTGGPGPDWPFVIFLSNVTRINIDSAELHDDVGWGPDYLQDFRRITDGDLARITASTTVRGYLRDLSSIWPEAEDQSGTVGDDQQEIDPGETRDDEEQSADLEPPKRVTTEVSRTIRNTALAKQLKREYDHTCQICGMQRKGRDGELYAEAHHLHPLGDSPPGPDAEQNLVVLCPNHHADFDYGRIRIDPETYEIDHAYENLERTQLYVTDGHELGEDYIRYNNQNVADF